MRKFLGPWFYFFIAVSSVFSLIGIVILIFLITTPSPDNIRKCFTTSMYKVHLCPGDKNYVSGKNISKKLKDAVILSEDASFYIHNGIDFFEMRESFEKNFEKGKTVRGGSTITQQLAKNLYLSAEKSFLRKIREIIIALRIEKILKKEEIMEKYLNVVEFGEGIYGVNKASWHYFSKPPSELDAAESAFLAFLLPNPKKYSQSFRQKQLTRFAKKITHTIVERMAKTGRIDELESIAANSKLENLFNANIDLNLDSTNSSDEESSEDTNESWWSN